MLKLFSLSAAAVLLSSSLAFATCPPSVPGDTAEAIRANAQRVLCLQEEIDERAQRRQFELELRANQNAIQSLQLQRRFDNLPRIQPPIVYTPAPSTFLN
jgi:hypothetical protein